MLTGTSVTAAALLSCRRQRPRSGLLASTRLGQTLVSVAGQGLEIRELRGYMPGDDPRHIDWRATGRTGMPLTRVFETQNDATCLHAIALTRSMYFGSRQAYKSVRTLELAADFGWRSIDDGARSAAVIGSPHGVDVQAPTGHQQRFASNLTVWADHSTLPARHAPSLDFYLFAQRVEQAARAAQTTVIWADFLPGHDWPYLLDRLSRKTVILVQATDPMEQSLPHSGEFYAEGDQGYHTLSGAPDIARRYAESRRQWFGSVLAPAHRAHFDWWICSTAESALSRP